MTPGALRKRINRKLAHRREHVVFFPSRGGYAIVDDEVNALISAFITLDEVALELGYPRVLLSCCWRCLSRVSQRVSCVRF
jgi:hypothetical protein